MFMCSLLAVFAPLKPVLLAVFGMVLLDFITGVLASKKRGESITSSGFKRTVIKLFIFEVAIMSAFITELYLTGDLAPIQKIVTCFVGLTEMTSITENLNDLSGGSLLKALIEKLVSKEDKILK